MDKQVVIIQGKTGSPYWGTNWLPLLGDKQAQLNQNSLSRLAVFTSFILPSSHMGKIWKLLGLPLLVDKQVVLIRGHTDCPY